MKKQFLFAVGIICSLALFAEDIPAGYYDAINGKKDAALKTALSQIIYPMGDATIGQTSSKPNNINVQYDAGNRCKYGTRAVNEKHSHQYTWDGFLYTDTRDDGTVWDMYSPYIHFMASDIYGAVSIPDLEIEHCFPKGWWGGTDNDAYKDLHHLNPANSRANNNKSACPPGYVATEIVEYSELFRMGRNSAYGKFLVYEPCDEYKGDFARAYFYIATAYEQFVWADNASDYLDNDSYLEFKPWLQQVLVEWNRLDPVSAKEIVRHDRVSDIQHNRNPFIDYPELVEYIWGNKKNTAVDISQLTFTGSEEYKLPIETLVSRAYPATSIRSTGFVANWENAGKDSYELDVFTSETTGHNDTLLAMSIFNSAAVKADEVHFSYTGAFGTTGIGKNSVTFGTKTNPLKLTVKGLTIPANAKIVIRAMAPLKINDTDGAKMKISADGTQIALQELTHDEEYYTFVVPAGTQNILIEQGNGKLFNVQQLFIISGDETTTHTSIAGYPKNVTGIKHQVNYPLEVDKPLYYTIKPEGLRTSVPVRVEYSGTDDPTSVMTPETASPAQKVFRNGQIVIVRNGVEYTVVGQTIR